MKIQSQNLQQRRKTVAMPDSSARRQSEDNTVPVEEGISTSTSQHPYYWGKTFSKESSNLGVFGAKLIKIDVPTFNGMSQEQLPRSNNCVLPITSTTAASLETIEKNASLHSAGLHGFEFKINKRKRQIVDQEILVINKGQRSTPKGAKTLTERLLRKPVGKRVSTAIGNEGVIGGSARSSSFSFP